ncbi:MAG: hypothetical protein SFV32_14535 [Opitutaceae bacterium]|nr:hypothetical protein [Opitutaceae bacterium]
MRRYSPYSMHHLGLLVTLIVLFLNLWGGALAVGQFLNNRWIAATVAPAVFATVMFAVETLVGLGSLTWLLVLTTAASVFLVAWCVSKHEPESWSDERLDRLWAWRDEFSPRRAWPVWTVFCVFFAYAFAWRWAFPNIDGSSEKISDLSYIASYMSGERIPVPDAWLHPYPSVHYYSFQHYAAALAGRMFNWPVGLTYNLTFSVQVALAAMGFTGALTFFVEKRWIQVLGSLSFVFGGSGAAGIVHWIYTDPAPWNGNRFIGSQPYTEAPLGTWLQEHASKYTRIEMPGEPFAYTIFLGDHHPPLSSFFLLGLTAMAIALWHKTRRRRYGLLVGGCLTWCVLGNTWVFPLMAVVVAVWWLWNRGQKSSLFWAVLAGACAVWFLAYGFLQPFLTASEQYKTALRLVPIEWHAPPILWILYLLPPLAIFVGCLYSRRSQGLWIGLTGLALLVFTEFFYIDDVYSGEFERFNSTLKWWPWIGSVAILSGAWLADKAGRAWVRGVAVFMLAYPCAFGFDILTNWVKSYKPDAGRLQGDAYLKATDSSRIMLTRLSQEPKGIVMERPNKDSYTNSASLPLFAGHRMWLGWVGHEALWRGYSGDIWQRQDNLNKLFAGEMENAGEWASVHGADYVLWYQEQDTNELLEVVGTGMKSHYLWKEIFVTPEGKRVGYWVRRGGVE